jgi:hypothetical protein
VIDLIGILLVVEGAGGLINRLTGGGSPAWFLQLRLVPAEFGGTASVVVLLVGAVVLLSGATRRNRRSH